MANELYRHVTLREEAVLGTRWCSHCMNRRPIQGGTWKTLNGGKNRRWQCMSCAENQKTRAAQTARA